ncbi:MAG: hypothetical protein AAF518_02460 [Spirochaetota bacterium]
MALTKEQKQNYNENLKEFKAYIEELRKEVNLYKSQMKRSKTTESYYKIGLVLNSVRFIYTCTEINKLSQHFLRLKSENYLNLGRKEIYSVFSKMEEVVTMHYDGSLAENEEQLAKITAFNPQQRLNFIYAFKDAIYRIIEGYGDNKTSSTSRWRWSWPEIHFKLAVLSKNLFDFKAYERERDINNTYYYVRKEHFDLIIEFCNVAAQEYRSKYDLSTNDPSDLRKSVSMLEITRKIYQITGFTEDLGKVKILIDSLNNKIDDIEKGKKKKKR